MTPSEFKAWFEGFTESMDGPPSLKQWERIRARVKQITGTPTTYPMYVDRYRPAIPYWTGLGQGVCSVLAVGQNTGAAPSIPNDVVTMKIGDGGTVLGQSRIGGTHLGADGHMARFSEGDSGTVFDSHSAMNALGKADAAAMAA